MMDSKYRDFKRKLKELVSKNSSEIVKEINQVDKKWLFYYIETEETNCLHTAIVHKVIELLAADEELPSVMVRANKEKLNLLMEDNEKDSAFSLCSHERIMIKISLWFSENPLDHSSKKYLDFCQALMNKLINSLHIDETIKEKILIAVPKFTEPCYIILRNLKEYRNDSSLFNRLTRKNYC